MCAQVDRTKYLDIPSFPKESLIKKHVELHFSSSKRYLSAAVELHISDVLVSVKNEFTFWPIVPVLDDD
jgi:hypothetical protein